MTNDVSGLREEDDYSDYKPLIFSKLDNVTEVAKVADIFNDRQKKKEIELANALKGRGKLRETLTIKQASNGFIVYEGTRASTPSEEYLSVYSDIDDLLKHITNHYTSPEKVVDKERNLVI